MGFGRACAPVRCAHPSFWAETGRCAPPLPIAASLILPAIFLGSNYVFYILTVCCITDMHINDIHTPAPPIAASLILTASVIICSENPAKCPSLAKNPPKYTTAYLVQQSNCRWHCEPTCFSSLASTMKSLFTPSLSDLYLSYLSISIPPLQTFRLVALVSLITKTKRIAERSAIVTHTHTHTHYHTQTDKVP